MRDEFLAPSTTPAPTDYRTEIVLGAGTLSTALAVVGVYFASTHGENVMGWYGNYVIPIGALLVGLAAASGYAIAAWVTGLKMTRLVFWGVAAQLAVSYFIAQYVQYRMIDFGGAGAGFWAWFDAVTRAFAWREHNGEAGEPFGLLGYGMRALEVAGFVGGGFLVPLLMASKAYCDPCRTYKRSRNLAMLPAGPKQKVFGGHPIEELEAAKREALAGVGLILDAAKEGDPRRFRAELDARKSRESVYATNKLTARVSLTLHRCPTCAAGELAASMSEGPADRATVTNLGAQALDGDRMRALFD